MQQTAPFIKLSLLDSSDSAAGVNAWLRAGSTVADGESAAATFTSVVGALSDAAIVSRHIVFRGVEAPRPDAPGAAPGAGAGVFVFGCATPDVYAVIILPAIHQDVLVIAGAGAGILIDQTASPVVAFVSAMLSNGLCNPFGVELVELLSAFYQWRP